MAGTYSVAEAKNRLPRLVHDAEKGATVTLTRKGKPVAVLIGCAELQKLQGQDTRFPDAYAALRKSFDLAKPAIAPGALNLEADLDQDGATGYRRPNYLLGRGL